MNLVDIGTMKNKIISELVRDENILDVLIGTHDDDVDIETVLFGKNGTGEDGCVYDFEYVPDVQENAKTFLCVEVVPIGTYGDTVTEMMVYVFAFCSKYSMKTYKRTGCAGNRIDILSSDVDRILNKNASFGIGPLEWKNSTVYKPAIPYYGRVLSYSVSAFRGKNRP